MKKKNILFIALASTLVVSIFVYWKYLFKARETSIKTQNVATPEFGLNSFRSDNLDFTVYIIPQRFEITKLDKIVFQFVKILPKSNTSEK